MLLTPLLKQSLDPEARIVEDQHFYLLRLLVHSVDVRPQNFLKVLSGRDVLVGILQAETAVLQGRGHVLDVVHRSHGEALELPAQIIAIAHHDGAALETFRTEMRFCVL